ncbi:hypothetical protein [Roseiconus lacunae]|uniref:hypothetical protein n=1 Tax=Roseiconus lacunae TaxID=2605694 RepID=UPI0011F2E681|nr:hypothetical protein [Roseiconus lacunae]
MKKTCPECGAVSEVTSTTPGSLKCRNCKLTSDSKLWVTERKPAPSEASPVPRSTRKKASSLSAKRNFLDRLPAKSVGFILFWVGFVFAGIFLVGILVHVADGLLAESHQTDEELILRQFNSMKIDLYIAGFLSSLFIAAFGVIAESLRQIALKKPA